MIHIFKRSQTNELEIFFELMVSQYQSALWKTDLWNIQNCQSSNRLGLSAESSCDKAIESIRFSFHQICQMSLSAVL